MKLRLNILLAILLLVLLAPVNAQGVENYFEDTVITMEGEVLEILSSYAFVMDRTEPFDFSPAEVVVINDDAEPFAVDVNVGRTVQVTGPVNSFDFNTILNTVDYEVEAALFDAYSSEDFSVVATLVTDPLELDVAADFTYDPDIVMGVETDPTPYLGENFIVEGYVSEILGPYSFRLDETGPFDLTPASFVVFNDTTDPFAVDINIGRYVRVTGDLYSFDLEALDADVDYDLIPEVYVDYGADDYAMVAESVVAVSARTPNTVYLEDEPTFPTIDDLEDNPFDYVGQTVTIEGEIAESYANSFILEEDEFFDIDPMRIPVFAGETIVDPDDWTDFFDDELYLVTGEVVAFNLLEIEEMIDFTPDPDLYLDYDENDIAIVASTVTQITE